MGASGRVGTAVKIYRIVSEQGKVYESNAFKGFYDTPERARRAIRFITKGYTRYKRKEGGAYYELERDAQGNLVVEEKIVYNWRVQEAEVTWNDYTFPGNS